MQPDQQQRILGYFIEEAREHLNTIEQGLLKLEDTLNDPEMINEVFRAAHSIKGGAAMLGLSSVQQTAHRLEDCFKLLKENRVEVDQKLESLFLGVADTLKALLDHVSSPFGLSEETASSLMSETEPLIAELNQHLEGLLESTDDSVVVNLAKPVATAPEPEPEPVPVQESKDWTEFHNQVLQSLREMLQLFKQSSTDLSRETLQKCCQNLEQLGEKYNLPNWSKLCKSASNAIANPDNSYLTLAKIIITEIKQAQELVIQDRESEIHITQELEALELIPEIELLELDLDEDEPLTTDIDIQTNLLADDLSADESNLELTDDINGNNLDGIPEITVIDTESNVVDFNSIFEDQQESVPLNNIIDLNGPEVGTDELGALEDLFQGDTPELDTWQQEITFDNSINEVANTNNQVEEVDQDLVEFLSLETESDDANLEVIEDDNTEDINLLFGDNLLESENLETSLHQDITELTADVVESTMSLEELEINLNDLELDDNDDLQDLLEINSLESGGEINSSTANVVESTMFMEELETTLNDLELDDNDGLQDLLEIHDLESEREINSSTANVVESTMFMEELETTLNDLELDDNDGLDLLEIHDLESLEELMKNDDGEESELEINKSQLENSSLDLFAELEEDEQEVTDDLDLVDLFALQNETGVETSQHQDDVNSFWDEFPTEPQPEITGDLEKHGSKEKEENLFAEYGNTNGHQELVSNLSFDFDDFDLSDNQEQEIDSSFSSDSEDNLFADLENSLSTDDTDQPDIIEMNQLSQSDLNDPFADISEDSEFDLFADLDNSSKENVTSALEQEKETHFHARLQEQDLHTSDGETNHEGRERQEEIRVLEGFGVSDQEKTQTGNHNLELDFEENTDSIEEEIETDLDLDTEILELLGEQEQPAELPQKTQPESLVEDIGIDLDLDTEILELLGEEELEETNEENLLYEEEETFSQENIQVPNLQTQASNAVENTETEFAELDALLDDKLTIPIENDDFAALTALLDNDFAVPPSSTAATVNEPTTTNAERSSEIADEFTALEDLLAQPEQTTNLPGRSVKHNISKTPRPAIRRAKEESMKVPVKQLDEMSNLVGEMVVNRNKLEQDHERLRQSLDNLLIQVQHLSDVGARMHELYERSLLEASLLKSRRARENGVNNNSNNNRGLDVKELDEFTDFHLLAQETIEYIVRLRESASDIDFVTDETERVARQFRQVTSQLQGGLTKARMVPFAQAIDRLRRGVRDNAIKYGKQVELDTEGSETLIDKMILDHLTDPLTHMLNNAIAHGIETPDVRNCAGKPAAGKISIRAFHQGNQTIIAVTDDGSGIDPEKVKKKALEKGVITSEEAKNMSRHEIYELLFLPSFSTADEVDDLKGRGVGMNVVLNDINEIRGTISTDSSVGKGTTFTIRLPLTLSICKALSCISEKSRIAFPMDGVEDTLDIPVTDIQKDEDGQSFIVWRDTRLPFRPLQEILAFNRQIARGNIYSSTRDDDMVSVVVLRSGNTVVALQVEQVLSEQEIVIKQFEGPVPKPSGVAGATVLGDGRIMPIADVLEIIDIFQGKMSKQIGGSSWQQRKPVSTEEETPDRDESTVLIVDDSITVRELLSLSFTKAGYRVEQARDGQEAWDKLRSGLPCDIVFCDIEMPRCDGLELLSRINKDNSLNHLPIAMLTSRGADKHKQMAFELGASGYFTKPYIEEALLEAASRMLKGEKLVTA